MTPLGPGDLYVHLAADGGIFVVPGDAPDHTAWVSLDDLRARVDRLSADAWIWLNVPEESPLTAAPAEIIAGSGISVRTAVARPDTRRQEGITALMSAAYVGAHGLVRDLLERGAPVEAADDKGATALLFAAQTGEADIVDTLLDAGADIDATDAERTTALMLSAWGGHTETVRRLVARGADQTGQRLRPGFPEGRPVDAYVLARDAGHPETAAALARPPGSVTFTIPAPWSPLALATAMHGIIVAVVVMSSDGPPDVGDGVAMVGVMAPAMALLAWRIGLARLEFSGSSVLVRAPMGVNGGFDASDVTHIRRWISWLGRGYRIRLREGGGGSFGARFFVPMALFGAPRADDELLSRIAAVPDVKADGKTAQALESWRRRPTPARLSTGPTRRQEN